MSDEAKEVRSLSDDEYVILEALKDARQERKNWDEQEQRCRAALLDSIGDADLLYYEGKYVGEIETRTSKRWNRKLFAKDWAALDSNPEYNTETKSKVIYITIGE